MRNIFQVFTFTLVICVVCSLPATTKPDCDDDDDEIVSLFEIDPLPSFRQQPFPEFNHFDGVIDTADPPQPTGFISFNPFGGFSLNRFYDIIRQFRDRASNPWGNTDGDVGIKQENRTLISTDTVSETQKDGGQKNTTTTVEMINGHRVVTNDTVYRKETPFGATVFKIRTIDYQPNNNETETVTENLDDTERVDGTKKVTENRAGIDEENEKKEVRPTTTTEENKKDRSREELDSNQDENEVDGDIDDNIKTSDVIDADSPNHSSELLEKLSVHRYYDDSNYNDNVWSTMNEHNDRQRDHLNGQTLAPNANNNNISVIDGNFMEINGNMVTTQPNEKSDMSTVMIPSSSIDLNAVDKQLSSSNHKLNINPSTDNNVVNGISVTESNIVSITSNNSNQDGDDVEFVEWNDELLSEESPMYVIDLSDDIKVNQMFADQGMAFNPDAEFIDINNMEAVPTIDFNDFKDIK